MQRTSSSSNNSKAITRTRPSAASQDYDSHCFPYTINVLGMCIPNLVYSICKTVFQKGETVPENVPFFLDVPYILFRSLNPRIPHAQL